MTFFLALLDSVSIYKCSDSTYLTNVYWAAGIRLCAMHWKQEKYKYDKKKTKKCIKMAQIENLVMKHANSFF